MKLLQIIFRNCGYKSNFKINLVKLSLAKWLIWIFNEWAIYKHCKGLVECICYVGDEKPWSLVYDICTTLLCFHNFCALSTYMLNGFVHLELDIYIFLIVIELFIKMVNSLNNMFVCKHALTINQTIDTVNSFSPFGAGCIRQFIVLTAMWYLSLNCFSRDVFLIICRLY